MSLPVDVVPKKLTEDQLKEMQFKAKFALMYIDPSQIDDMIMKKRRDAGLSEVKRRPRHNRSLLSVDSGGEAKNNNSAMSLY